MRPGSVLETLASDRVLMTPYTHKPVHIVIGIPYLMVGGTEMQTLMVVKAVGGEDDRGQRAEGRRQLALRSSQSEKGKTENTAGKNSYRVTVVCYFEHDAGMMEQFRLAGAEVVLLNLNPNIHFLRLIATLKTVWRKLQPSILHVQYMAPGLLPIVAARLAGINNILAAVHQPATPYGRIPRLLLRIGAMLCRKFVCVSQATEKSWFGNCSLSDARSVRTATPLDTPESAPRKVTRLTDGAYSRPDELTGRVSQQARHLTIHNAVDIEAIDRILASTDHSRLCRELGLENAVVVGTVARLSPEKGVDLLIKAFASMQSKFPAARLLIVGDGRARNSLTQLARELGQESRIVWVGSQPWERAMQYMTLMDVVVIPSRYEGFGLTAIEAMACSKPVVAFALDGISEVIGNGIPGALVPAGDVQALSDSIAAFLASKERRKSAGQSGRERVEALFGAELFTKRWRELYEI